MLQVQLPRFRCCKRVRARPCVAEARKVPRHGGVRNTPLCLNLSVFLPRCSVRGSVSDGPQPDKRVPSVCGSPEHLTGTAACDTPVSSCSRCGARVPAMRCEQPAQCVHRFLWSQTYPRGQRRSIRRHCPRGMVWIVFQAQHARALTLPQPRSAVK